LDGDALVLASSGLPTLESVLGGEGYPEKSEVLVVGSPGCKAVNVDFTHKVSFWLSSERGQIKYDINDVASLFYNIKDVLKKNGDPNSEQFKRLFE